MNKDELLRSRLAAYRDSGVYPFHMPGHKRREDYELLKDFPNPFSIDITEIDGFDNLHHPEGILKTSMEWAASVYGADKTYYLINGSSCGVLSAVSASVTPNGKILMSRNCHKSAYHGVILNQLDSVYVYPQIINSLGIQGVISAGSVEKELKAHPDIQAVLIVSPTYDGVVSDIASIANVVHDRDIPLIVDEAHGAHFSFAGGDFPKSALDCGADLVIQSLHKTLPSMTQTAVLHGRRGYVDLERLERYLQIYQSSSPSYILMASIEQCIFEMDRHGRFYLKQFQDRLMAMRKKLAEMKALQLFQMEENLYDPSKIVVSCRNCMWVHTDGSRERMDGNKLSERLRREFQLEMEMSGADYVVAIATYLDSEDGLERLYKAFTAIDQTLERSQEKNHDFIDTCSWEKPDIQIPMWKAMEMKSCGLVWEECVGKISAEFVYLYPPGIPIVAPGEVVTDQIVKQIKRYKKLGFPVQGMADAKAEKLKVLL